MSSSDNDTAQSLVEEGREHYRVQRPLAAWASWRRALGFVADFPPAVQALEALYQAEPLPAAARTALRFEAPSSPVRRKRWDRLFKTRDLDDLADASEAFAALVEHDASDDSAWYNFAVCLAWLGRQPEAIEALRQVVGLRAESRLDAAVAAWVLAEVVRAGGGAEALADDLAYALTLRCDDDAVEHWLAASPGVQPAAAPAGQAPGPRAFTWLDRPIPQARDDLQLGDVPRVLAQVLKLPGTIRLSSPVPAMLDQAYAQLVSALGNRVEPVRREAVPLPLPLLDAALWNFRLPPGLDAEIEQRIRRAAVEHYYEDVWIHETRHALEGLTPRDAARHDNAVRRALLTAVVRFREQLGERAWTASLYQGYPFDRLRRRLGLETAESATVDPADIACMGERELDALREQELDDARLTEAYESASGLRVDRLTARFAAELTRRNAPSLDRLDTPAVIAPLVREAMNADHADEALHWLDQARALNAGRDRGTFDIWSAEVLARSGDPDGARSVYEQLLARDPANADLALDAAETLLDNGYPDHARPLLARALDLARERGDHALIERAETLLAAVARATGPGARATLTGIRRRRLILTRSASEGSFQHTSSLALRVGIGNGFPAAQRGRLGTALDRSQSTRNPIVTPPASAAFLNDLKWTPDGLIAAIVQDVETNEVLMMAWMDENAVRRTLETGQAHFYSRSRRAAWHKGETSGHVQHVESIAVDCDADVLLLTVRQVGGACHEGYRSCFFRRVTPGGRLEVVAEPVFRVEDVYGPGAGGR